MYDLTEIGPPPARVAYPEPDRQDSLDNIETPLLKVGKVEDWLADRIRSDAQIRASILEHVNNNASHLWDGKRKIKYESCGQTVKMVNIETGEIREEKHFCNNATYCPNCQRIQAKKKRLSLKEDIPHVNSLNHERVQRILPIVSSVQEDIAHVRRGMETMPSYGKVGSTKKYYREVLERAILLLKTVKDDIRLKEIRVALNGAREAIRAKGFNTVEIGQHLDDARKRLEDQINYKWQHVMVSVRTGKKDKRGPMSVLKKCWPILRRKKFTCYPETAGFESVELEGAAHLHAVYLGPQIDQKELSDEWCEITTAKGIKSFKVWVEDAYEIVDGIKIYGTDNAVVEAVKYGIKMKDKPVEEIFAYADALKGRKRFQRWGTLRGLGERKKRKAPIIGKYTAPDGGVDIVRDTRPVRNGQIYEYLS